MLGKITLTKNNGGGGGGDANLNVFAQNTEPTTTEGVWIDTSATGDLPELTDFEPACIELIPTDLKNGNGWELVNWVTGINYHLGSGQCLMANVGDFIYNYVGDYNNNGRCYKINAIDKSVTEINAPPGSGARSNKFIEYGNNLYVFAVGGNKAYKLDTSNDTWTQLADMPYTAYTQVALKGTDVYLFSETNDKLFYKYNILTNEYTQLSSNSSFALSASHQFIIGDKIYFVSGTIFSIYDIENDTFTETTAPYDTSYCGACMLSTDFYIFGGTSSGGKNAYKYDTITNEWTRLADLPEGLGKTNAILTDDGIVLYVFGAGTSIYSVYLYNHRNNTYAKLQNLPDGLANNASESYAIYNDNIYLAGTGSSQGYGKYCIFKLSIKEFINDYIYICYALDEVNVKLSDKLSIPVSNAYISKNGSLKQYPAYYGDGTQWNLLPS